MIAREFRIGDLCDLTWSSHTLAVVIDNHLFHFDGRTHRLVKVYDSDPRLEGLLVVHTTMLEVIAQ
jgi:hypothetical protein